MLIIAGRNCGSFLQCLKVRWTFDGRPCTDLPGEWVAPRIEAPRIDRSGVRCLSDTESDNAGGPAERATSRCCLRPARARRPLVEKSAPAFHASARVEHVQIEGRQ